MIGQFQRIEIEVLNKPIAGSSFTRRLNCGPRPARLDSSPLSRDDNPRRPNYMHLLSLLDTGIHQR